MNYIATEGECLDSIYFKYYGLKFNQNQYDDFMMDNFKLLLKDTLDGGDEVYIREIKPTQEDEIKGLYGIDI
ncbi:hypothetical protein [Helicobacter cappadocius]|uniref:Uncharacterized protein n=1 Tax=Helicobacter cappadocius TaxID=3063998 RepID=A0AA90PMB2_9HELI|nr:MULTISPECIES: hypothetical protein [unclassified Helicobacter]MDO7253908.1 hypothetical protein [Helicobacter sp. faydin-H75]MDP2539769.1 hypothetical protein [Helicobacter sp. faydin-H76]